MASEIFYDRAFIYVHGKGTLPLFLHGSNNSYDDKRLRSWSTFRPQSARVGEHFLSEEEIYVLAKEAREWPYSGMRLAPEDNINISADTAEQYILDGMHQRATVESLRELGNTVEADLLSCGLYDTTRVGAIKTTKDLIDLYESYGHLDICVKLWNPYGKIQLPLPMTPDRKKVLIEQGFGYALRFTNSQKPLYAVTIKGTVVEMTKLNCLTTMLYSTEDTANEAIKQHSINCFVAEKIIIVDGKAIPATQTPTA